MRVAIVGAGLAGMATAIDLVDAGCEVEIFESRPFVGGKVEVGSIKTEITLRWVCTSFLAVIIICLPSWKK